MENLRGAALMTVAMLAFAVEDVLIKTLGERIPSGQIITVIGVGGIAAFIAYFIARKQPIWVAQLTHPKVLLRTGFEAFGTVFFISALLRMDVTLLSAIIQATPLVVALGGVIFLGQSVGWRRWAAIGVGFVGVLLIMRPGLDGIDTVMVLGILGMLGLAGRDLVTRAIDGPISGAHLSLAAFSSLIPAGLLLMWIEGDRIIVPNATDSATLVLCIAVGLCAYLAIVAATRSGDAAFVSMFRYTRMLFALILGILVLGERPDRLTLLGAAIVIAAGVFTLLREAHSHRPSQTSDNPV
ncbi:MAG: DMT family transporter [Pseudomonadota bacterium]